MEHPDPGSEDFSRVLQRVPGAFVFLGAAIADDPVGLPDNHAPRAMFDDEVLVDGAVLLAELALRRGATPPA
jgi:hippurate hydrolase